MSHPRINTSSSATDKPVAEERQPDDDLTQQPASATQASAPRQAQVKTSSPQQWEEGDGELPPPPGPARKKKGKNSSPPQQWEDDSEEEENDREEPQAVAEPEAKRQAPPQVVQYGVLNGFFNGLSALGPIAILLLLGCMAWPMFWQPGAGVFCPAEIKGVSGFLHCLTQQSWLAPTGLENGAFSLPLWPAFSWWIGLFALVPQLVQTGLLLPVATFAAAFLAACGVWALALAAGFGRKAALAGAFILICSPIFAPLPHFVGPAALAAAFMLFALAFFCCGWMAQRAWISLPLAFTFTALAGLAGGPLPFAVPLLASIFFLVWRATFSRAQHLDAVTGFFLMLVIIGVWIGALMLGEGHEAYFANLMAHSARYAWPLPSFWLIAIVIGIVGLIPWFLMILGVSWFRVLGRSVRTLSASRHINGSALCWLALIFSICAAPFTTVFHTAAIAIACLGAVLLGKAFVNLGSLGNRFFFALACVFILLAGIIICLVTYPDTQPMLFERLPMLAGIPDLGKKFLSLPTLPIMGYICIAASIPGFFFVKRSRGSGGLVFAAIVAIVLCQPGRLMLVPEIAAMPGTPLVSYAAVEKQVEAALTPKPSVVIPEAQPAVEPTEPVQPAEEPAVSAQPGEQLAAPEQSAPVSPYAEPAPAPAPETPAQIGPEAVVSPAVPQPAAAPEATVPATTPQATATEGQPAQAEQSAAAQEADAQSANPVEKSAMPVEEVIVVEEAGEQPDSKAQPAPEKTDKK